MMGNSSTRGEAAGLGAVAMTAVAGRIVAVPFWRDPVAVGAPVAVEVGADTTGRGGTAASMAALPFAPTVVHALPPVLCALGTT